mmetsp:Transcript_5006/g.18791  ORF Transcript_5006/g.18791 Transcript_5006/m.18791 type:complete len:292 (+) Transcript_5006:2364-3239(+)
MPSNATLKDKTLLISGASRGIGLAIACAAARQGANIAILAKTNEPHPKLPGTIHTAAQQIRDLGGKALPIVTDIRDEAQVQRAVEETVREFGGIDILVNNASAISLTPTEKTSMKRFDLMNSVNCRGTFVCSKIAIPHLKKSTNPHILNISPPLEMRQQFFENHTAYTIAKMGMSLCALGMSGELKNDNIAVNCLWPRFSIATAAVQNLLGGDTMIKYSRTPEMMADAAVEVLNSDSFECTGNFFIDEDVLENAGMPASAQATKYAVVPGENKFIEDFFLPDNRKSVKAKY